MHKKTKIIVLGEALVDLFAEPGKKLEEAEVFTSKPGGAAANVAAIAALLGGDSSFVSKVGNDDFGHLLRKTLRDCGVNIDSLLIDNNAPTMLAVVGLSNPNSPQFILYHGANELLKIQDLPISELEDAKVLVFSSVLLATKSGDAVLEGARLAYQAGKQVIFDFNYRPNVWSAFHKAQAAIEKALNFTSIVKLNETEMELFTGTKNIEEAADYFRHKGIKMACVSMGSEGAYITTDSSIIFVPPYLVSVANTTGCGDAFVAGLAYQISCREGSFFPAVMDASELKSMVSFANACGALTASYPGAINTEINLNKVEQFMFDYAQQAVSQS